VVKTKRKRSKANEGKGEFEMESKFVKNDIQKKQMKVDQHISGVAATVFGILLVVAVLGAVMMDGRVSDLWIGLFVAGLILVGTYVLFALKVASQWEKAVLLRLGKFHGLRGPGVFWIIPIVDAIPSWIDHRVMVTPFSAEKTLTKDTVPVDVDAVLF
jgi:regulator of protease activity HflC (stomatin/prohibitin superfamily)